MPKTTAEFANAVLIIVTGLLFFLVPIKFGMPSGFDILDSGRDIFELLFFSWPNDILWAGLIVLFSLWMITGIFIGKVKIKYSLLEIFIFIFVLTSVISAFFSPDKYRARLCVIQYFGCFLAYLLALNLAENREDLRFYRVILILPAVLISVYAIYQHYIGLPETKMYACQYLNPESSSGIKERLESGRVFSTFIYPNTLAGYLVLCIPLVFFITAQKKWHKRVFQLLTVLVMLYALYLTFYKGRGAAEKIKSTLVFRLENWTAGVRMIKEHPIIGIGPDNFGVLYPKYKLDIAEEVQNAHNNFLQVFAEQGVFGFFSFCLMFFIVIKKGLKGFSKICDAEYRWTLLGLTVGIAAFSIHNLLDFDWYVPGVTVVAWIFMGVIINISGFYKQKEIIIKRIWIKISVISAVVLILIFSLMYLEKTFISRYYLIKAEAVFNEGDFVMAEALARTSMRTDKTNPDTYFLLAEISAKNRDYKQGVLYCEDALKYNPYSARTYYYKGLLYIYEMQKSRDMFLIDRVGDAFKKAVEFYPANPFYHLQLAQFYEAENHPKDAIREYDLTLELNSKIENEYKKYGKGMRHLILSHDIVRSIEERRTILR